MESRYSSLSQIGTPEIPEEGRSKEPAAAACLPDWKGGPRAQLQQSVFLIGKAVRCRPEQWMMLMMMRMLSKCGWKEAAAAPPLLPPAQAATAQPRTHPPLYNMALALAVSLAHQAPQLGLSARKGKKPMQTHATHTVLVRAPCLFHRCIQFFLRRS